MAQIEIRDRNQLRRQVLGARNGWNWISTGLAQNSQQWERGRGFDCVYPPNQKDQITLPELAILSVMFLAAIGLGVVACIWALEFWIRK